MKKSELSIQPSNPLSGKIKYAQTDLQIMGVVDLDHDYFGEDGYRFEDLKAMVERYPHGTYLLTQTSNNKLLLTIGIWPITKELYLQMRDEALLESQVKPSDILQDDSGQYWWIAGFLGNPNNLEVGPRLVAKFIAAVLETWTSNFSSDKALSITATGFSSSGQSLLKRFAFDPMADQESHRYCLDTNVKHVKETINTLLPKD